MKGQRKGGKTGQEGYNTDFSRLSWPSFEVLAGRLSVPLLEELSLLYLDHFRY